MLLLVVVFSHSVMSNSLQPHGLHHVWFPCPSPSPGVWANSCPLNQWHHSTISSSVVPFSSYSHSVPASKSFLISRLFASGSQSIGASTSASVLHMTIQSWFPLGLVSLQSKGLLRLFSSTTVQKRQFFGILPSLWSDSHIRTWLLEKNCSFDYTDFGSKVVSLLFNMLSRLVIAFLPRSMCLLISWLKSPSVVILETKTK